MLVRYIPAITRAFATLLKSDLVLTVRVVRRLIVISVDVGRIIRHN